jgi:hypothetical protein
MRPHPRLNDIGSFCGSLHPLWARAGGVKAAYVAIPLRTPDGKSRRQRRDP